MTNTTEPTVEACLQELKDMLPDVSFISVKTHVIYQPPLEHRPQADIQIEDRGFRRESLSECMAQVRAWKEK